MLIIMIQVILILIIIILTLIMERRVATGMTLKIIGKIKALKIIATMMVMTLIVTIRKNGNANRKNDNFDNGCYC